LFSEFYQKLELGGLKYLFSVRVELPHTVIIFLARNGRTRAVKFRPKNFGRISFDLGEIFPNQQILRLSNGNKGKIVYECEIQVPW
jgi:hypothetical protein